MGRIKKLMSMLTDKYFSTWLCAASPNTRG